MSRQRLCRLINVESSVRGEIREQHQAFVATPGDKPIWNDFPGAA
jgi:hypothetical protein